MSDFTDLVAVVTGGASGIGAATAKLLAERGARVAVLDRDVADVDSTAFAAVPCDVTSTAAVDAAISDVVSRLGGIDILVNNAGIGAVGDVTENGDDEWHRVLDVNVVGHRPRQRERPCLTCASRHTRRSSIPAPSSPPSGVPQRAVYAASKGAVAALTLAMAADHVADGVRVNAVTPGTADTPWVERLLEQSGDAAAAAEALRARQPMGRLVTADEVAYAIAYLASPMSGVNHRNHPVR